MWCLPEFTGMETKKLSDLLKVTCVVQVETLTMIPDPMLFSL